MTFDLSVLHKNKTVSSVVGLFLVLYGGLAKPKLPGFIRSMFENPVFRVVILALIMYRGNKDPQLSLMLSVAFVMIMNKLNEEKIKEEFIDLNNLNQANEWINKKSGYDYGGIIVGVGLTIVGGIFAITLFSGVGSEEDDYDDE